MGVTGGTPLGFDVGAKGAGGTLPGLDLVRPTSPEIALISVLPLFSHLFVRFSDSHVTQQQACM